MPSRNDVVWDFQLARKYSQQYVLYAHLTAVCTDSEHLIETYESNGITNRNHDVKL
jgi:hypothetical protein